MLARNTSQIAVSAPVVQHQGLGLGTTVLTMDGNIPVEYLTAGDRIVTRNGCRKLVGITVRALEPLELVRIMAGVLGHNAPEADVLLGADQAILIRDWRAKALCGQDQAMIAARKLVDGQFIRTETQTMARLFTLHFDTAEVIYAGNLELSCPAMAVTA